jgi:hypothetical protein
LGCLVKLIFSFFRIFEEKGGGGGCSKDGGSRVLLKFDLEARKSKSKNSQTPITGALAFELANGVIELEKSKSKTEEEEKANFFSVEKSCNSMSLNASSAQSVPFLLFFT